MALTAAQIHNMTRNGQVTSADQLSALYWANNAPMPAQITYAQLTGGPGADANGNQPDDAPVAPAAPTGPAKPQLNQAAVDATNKAISSLDIERDTGYRNIDDSFNSLISRYGKEAAQNEADYREQGETNTNNLVKNKQNALVAAAQGRRGLRGSLAAIGALSGDGGVLADRAVTAAANQDIGEAADTYAGNAVQLDKAIGRLS